MCAGHVTLSYLNILTPTKGHQLTHDVDFPEPVDRYDARRWAGGGEYLQSHEAGTLCHVIRLLEKDLASLNNLDLSPPLCVKEIVRWQRRARLEEEEEEEEEGEEGVRH